MGLVTLSRVGFWLSENPIDQDSKFECVICFIYLFICFLFSVFLGTQCSISVFGLEVNEFELVQGSETYVLRCACEAKLNWKIFCNNKMHREYICGEKLTCCFYRERLLGFVLLCLNICEIDAKLCKSHRFGAVSHYLGDPKPRSVEVWEPVLTFSVFLIPLLCDIGYVYLVGVILSSTKSFIPRYK